MRFVNCLGLILLTSMIGRAQSSPATQPQPIPSHVLYEQFVRYQNHLDRVAANAVLQGKDGSDFRNHFQQKVGFTDAQFALVRTAAQQLETDLNAQDAKARVVINAFRQAHQGATPPATVPPPPAELAQLQAQRDQMVNDEIAILKTALGSTAAAKLDDVIQKEMGPNVKYQSIAVPNHDPAHNPVPPFTGVK